MDSEENDVEMEELPPSPLPLDAPVAPESDKHRASAEKKSHYKAKPIGKNWSDLSENWIAEERGAPRNPEIDGSPGQRIPIRDPRKCVSYADESLGDRSKKEIESRLDFKNRKSASEMRSFAVSSSGVQEEDDEDGELFSEDDDVQDQDEDDEEETDTWTKRLVGPRMKMYADEEEENRKHNRQVLKKYGDLKRLGTRKNIKSRLGNYSDGKKVSVKDRLGHRTHD